VRNPTGRTPICHARQGEKSRSRSEPPVNTTYPSMNPRVKSHAADIDLSAVSLSAYYLERREGGERYTEAPVPGIPPNHLRSSAAWSAKNNQRQGESKCARPCYPSS
jgi:hypothetical protein